MNYRFSFVPGKLFTALMFDNSEKLFWNFTILQAKIGTTPGNSGYLTGK